MFQDAPGRSEALQDAPGDVSRRSRMLPDAGCSRYQSEGWNDDMLSFGVFGRGMMGPASVLRCLIRVMVALGAGLASGVSSGG